MIIPPYIWKFIFGAILLAMGGFGTLLLKSGWDDYNTSGPTITFRRVAFFWIEIQKNTYQIGTVIRLFNLGDKPYLVKGVALDASEPTYYGRGQTYLRKIFVTGPRTEITDDNLMKPASEATFKMLLPIRVEATVVHPPPLGVVFVGQWSLLLEKAPYPVNAEFFGTFDRVVSMDEWTILTRPTSGISIDDVSYQRLGASVPKNAPYSDYVLFNPDRSATYQAFGYDQTPATRADAGTIVYLRGKGAPPRDGGWVLLGHSYEEVWADGQKTALYNSIFPPDSNGEPRRIAVFQ